MRRRVQGRAVMRDGIQFAGRRLEWTDRRRSVWYDSWAAFLADAERGADPVDGSARCKEADADFDLNTGWSGALDLARHGWPDGMVGVRELSAWASAAVLGLVRRPTHQFDLAGDYYDVGRVVECNPECAVRFVRAQRSGRVVRIVVSVGACGGVSAEQFKRRGAAVLALIDALEVCGVRCEVVVGSTIVARIDNKESSMSFGCCIKAPSDPVDLDLLAFAISHPAVLRRVVWALREGHSPEWRSAFSIRRHGGYGCPETYRVPDDGSDTVSIPVIGSSRVWDTDAGMMEWLKGQVVSKVEVDAE